MLLRAQAIGEEPYIRFIVVRLEDGAMWNGETFTSDFDSAKKYWHPSDACIDMQAILKEHYQHLPEKKYIVPVEITGCIEADAIGAFLVPLKFFYFHTRPFLASVPIPLFDVQKVVQSDPRPIFHAEFLFGP